MQQKEAPLELQKQKRDQARSPFQQAQHLERVMSRKHQQLAAATSASEAAAQRVAEAQADQERHYYRVAELEADLAKLQIDYNSAGVDSIGKGDLVTATMATLTAFLPGKFTEANSEQLKQVSELLGSVMGNAKEFIIAESPDGGDFDGEDAHPGGLLRLTRGLQQCLVLLSRPRPRSLTTGPPSIRTSPTARGKPTSRTHYGQISWRTMLKGILMTSMVCLSTRSLCGSRQAVPGLVGSMAGESLNNLGVRCRGTEFDMGKCWEVWPDSFVFDH